MSGSRFNLSALAVRERSVTLFLIVLVTIAGIYAFFGLGRAEDPPFTVKQMTVITVWPGATAQEIQDQVAEPLEKRLQELKASPRNTAEIKASLQSVQTKWNYIEKSLKNYNENSVPFLISKYSEQIISGLEKTSELYAAGKL